MIVFAAVVPHPPLSVPGIGDRDDFSMLKKTLASYDILRKGLEDARPDLIIMISPHGYMEPYSFIINSASDLVGNFSKFSLDKSLSFKNDLDVAEKIIYSAQINEITAYFRPDFLDHGSLVPLFHLAKNINPKLIHLSFSLMNFERHYRYGEIISRILADEKKRVAIIASGDLSHRLSRNSPAGYSPGEVDFDKAIIKLLETNKIASLIKIEQKMMDEAAECGLRSIVIMLGMLSDRNYKFKLLSYEHPFGIGYLTARFV